jgi:hypothetical protein
MAKYIKTEEGYKLIKDIDGVITSEQVETVQSTAENALSVAENALSAADAAQSVADAAQSAAENITFYELVKGDSTVSNPNSNRTAGTTIINGYPYCKVSASNCLPSDIIGGLITYQITDNGFATSLVYSEVISIANTVKHGNTVYVYGENIDAPILICEIGDFAMQAYFYFYADGNSHYCESVSFRKYDSQKLNERRYIHGYLGIESMSPHIPYYLRYSETGDAIFPTSVYAQEVYADSKKLATEEYIDNAVAQKSQVQFITWEADD